MKKIKPSFLLFLKRTAALIYLALNDLLFIIGSLFFLTAAYRINDNAGLILTGVFFMFYAYLITKKRR